MSPSASGAAINADTRRRSLAAMAAGDLDVLVVGGGITGVGAALDGASRGLEVGLVEASDFASGRVEQVEQGDPRWPAVSGDGRHRARA